MNELLRYAVPVACFAATLLLYGAALTNSDSRQISEVLRGSKRLGIVGQILSISPPMALLACFMACLVLPFLLMFWRFPVGVLAMICAIVGFIFLPWWGNALIRNRMRKAFEEQLPGFVDLLVSAVRGNLPLAVAIANVAPLLKEPLRGEIHRFANEATQGRGGMEAAIANARKRNPSRNYSMLLSVIGVFAGRGGNLVEPVQTMSKAFKDIHRLHKKLETATSTARAAFWVINIALLGIVVTLSVAAPELLDMTFKSLVGGLIFFAGMIIWAGASTILYQLTRVEI